MKSRDKNFGYGVRLFAISVALVCAHADAGQPIGAPPSLNSLDVQKALTENPGRVGKTAPSTPISLTGAFTWGMVDRTGLDRNKNDRMDLPNTSEYVLNLPPWSDCQNSLPERPAYRTVFTAAYEDVRSTYVWTIRTQGDGGGGVPLHENSQRQWSVCLPEGQYTVNLFVNGGSGERATSAQTISVRDILVVSLGDSYASGEGNPEATTWSKTKGLWRAHWADDGSKGSFAFSVRASSIQHMIQFVAEYPKANWRPKKGEEHSGVLASYATSSVNSDHLRSHRSTLSGPAQAALTLERSDPHTSVTFVSVAASGATLKKGVLGPYRGTRFEPLARVDKNPMPSQLDQVQALVGTRRIDALLLSIGGNDVGFSNVVAALVLRESGHPPSLTAINEAFRSGWWDIVEREEPNWLEVAEDLGLADPVKWAKGDGLDNLPDVFSRLSSELNARFAFPKSREVIANLYLTAYPSLTIDNARNGKVEMCGPILDSLFDVRTLKGQYKYKDLQVSHSEQEWADSHILGPLNKTLHSIADSNNWIFIDDHLEEFAGHGLCRPKAYDPDDYPGNPFPRGVKLNKGEIRWGRLGKESESITLTISGLMHPNEFGNRAIANAILGRLILE